MVFSLIWCVMFPFSPTPVVSWVKRNGDVPSGRASFLNFDKTLRITDVSEADAGEYRCNAKNQHGSVHHTIRVTVNGEHTNIAALSSASDHSR